MTYHGPTKCVYILLRFFTTLNIKDGGGGGGVSIFCVFFVPFSCFLSFFAIFPKGGRPGHLKSVLTFTRGSICCTSIESVLEWPSQFYLLNDNALNGTSYYGTRAKLTAPRLTNGEILLVGSFELPLPPARLFCSFHFFPAFLSFSCHALTKRKKKTPSENPPPIGLPLLQKRLSG